MAKRGPKEITSEHLHAMEVGRAEGRTVREYLEMLRISKPKRGRKRTKETIQARLTAVAEEIPQASPLEELKLIQERRDLENELAAMNSSANISDVEAAFIKVAKSYGARKGISYASWREVGVPASVLKQAGISRAE